MKRYLFAFTTSLFAVFLFATAALAAEALPAAEDPQLEARVLSLAEELRCLVCQNQTLADSHAALAIDLRNQVREQLRAGKSEREVIEYLVARYGDFVLYRPPVKAVTWLLWFGPFLLLVAALIALIVKLAKRRQRELAPLSATEHARAAELLINPQEGGPP